MRKWKASVGAAIFVSVIAAPASTADRRQEYYESRLVGRKSPLGLR
jgi:hypothetical protein